MNFKSLFSHGFQALDLGFWVPFETFRVFEIFWDFFEMFRLGVVYLMIYDHALHSISIFTMFHAFRCVLECWKLCVGRFRLGWTHDAIIFSTPHVHAYFMHTHPFFPFFVLFCDCVMSLSLSLSDRLRMAPKRKSTLAWNGSSSDLPTPLLHVWFHDGKAQQDFPKNFQKCGVHPEHHVVLSYFFETLLPHVIRTRGWESLCEIPLRCPLVFI